MPRLAVSVALVLVVMAAEINSQIPTAKPHEQRNEILLKTMRENMEVHVLSESLNDEDRLWKMTGTDGRTVHCEVAEEERRNDLRSDRRMKNGDLSKEQVLEEADGLFDILGGRCLTMEKGYWSYDFCPSGIYQFHGQSRESADVAWSLGEFDSSYSNVATVNFGPADIADAKDESLLYVSFRYFNGQPCDETGLPRESRAVFFCCANEEDGFGTGADKVLKFESIEEHSLCNYTLTLCSPFLCKLGLEPRGSDDAWSALRAISGLCFQKTLQWWTYEFCVEKQIRQFHVEERNDKDGRRKLEISSNFELGRYVGSTDFSLPSRVQKLRPMDVDSGAKELLFFDRKLLDPAIVQVYSGGSPCDVGNAESRFTMVRYVCDAGATELNAILYVEEVSSCIYQIIFHTELVCQHPLFAKAESSSRRVVCEVDAT